MCTRFGKPRVRLTNKYNGWDDPCACLARWTQAYGKTPTWMHMNSVLKCLVNKHVLGGGNVKMALNVGKTLCRKNSRT